MGQHGHPGYLHTPQGAGRLDNPQHYATWYFAVTPEAAIGEAFGDITVWGEDMFELPTLPGSRRALGFFDLADDISLLDLDDARALLDRGLRPTQVIDRNRSLTQSWALAIFNERNDMGARCWSGVCWWSYPRPHWTVIGIWQPPAGPQPHHAVRVDPLDMSHAAVIDAARTLNKTFV